MFPASRWEVREKEGRRRRRRRGEGKRGIFFFIFEWSDKKNAHLESPSPRVELFFSLLKTLTKKQVWDSGKGYGEYTVKGK